MRCSAFCIRSACTVSAVVIFAVAPAQRTAPGPPAIQSVFTKLDGPACKLVSETIDSAVHKCAGAAGWSLLALHGDQRMSLTAVTPTGSENPLDFWDVVTRRFSSVEGPAEWRVATRGGTSTPIALIIRLRQGDETLVVISKLSAKSCVTAAFRDGTKTRAQVVAIADKAQAGSCLPRLP